MPNPFYWSTPKRIAALTLATAVLGACASMDDTAPAKLVDGMLTGPHGMTLDTFDKDTAGIGLPLCQRGAYFQQL